MENARKRSNMFAPVAVAKDVHSATPLAQTIAILSFFLSFEGLSLKLLWKVANLGTNVGGECLCPPLPFGSEIQKSVSALHVSYSVQHLPRYVHLSNIWRQFEALAAKLTSRKFSFPVCHSSELGWSFQSAVSKC